MAQPTWITAKSGSDTVLSTDWNNVMQQFANREDTYGTTGAWTLTAASTVDLGGTEALKGVYGIITGNTGITSFGNCLVVGTRKVLYFTGTPLITHGTSLKLPGAVNCQVVAGDVITFVAENAYTGSTATVWRCVGIVGQTSRAPATTYAYLNLSAQSVLVPITLPASVDQYETALLNNYVYNSFTNNSAATESMQWITEFPADWVYGTAISVYAIWTALAGTAAQTVKWDISGKLFTDGSDINTALAAVGSQISDDYQAAGLLHISAAATGVLSAVGTGGTTAIFKVTRGDGSLTGAARLLALRIKYQRTLA